jgi:hypothetical protein
MLVAIFGVLRRASRFHQIDIILKRSRPKMLGRSIFGVLGNWSHFWKSKWQVKLKTKMLKTVVASNLGGFFNCQILKVRTSKLPYFYIMLE